MQKQGCLGQQRPVRADAKIKKPWDLLNVGTATFVTNDIAVPELKVYRTYPLWQPVQGSFAYI